MIEKHVYSTNQILFKESCFVKTYMYMWISWCLCIFIDFKENYWYTLTKLVKSTCRCLSFGARIGKFDTRISIFVSSLNKRSPGIMYDLLFDVFVYFSRCKECFFFFFFGKEQRGWCGVKSRMVTDQITSDFCVRLGACFFISGCSKPVLLLPHARNFGKLL